MPFKDPERRREAQREATRRRRAAHRAVAPTVTPATEPAPVTRAALRETGRILGVARGDGETDKDFHARIRLVWKEFLKIVEP